MRPGPEAREVLADETAPTDSASPSEVEEERSEAVVGRVAVQQAGLVGNIF